MAEPGERPTGAAEFVPPSMFRPMTDAEARAYRPSGAPSASDEDPALAARSLDELV